MITIDGRYTTPTGNIYRMVGYCVNCGMKPILMLFDAGQKARNLDCPTCGCWFTVNAQRLAGADEIPFGESMPPPRPDPMEDRHDL